MIKDLFGSINMKLVLMALFALSSSIPAIAGEYQPGYATSQSCTRNEYREEYVPGTQKSPGYVKSWNETVEVPCGLKPQNHINQAVDNNDCSEGSLIGGILGAGLATSSSRGKDRFWAIPAGAISGAMIGCQVDGG